jgi:hypothetical protein
MLLAAATVAFLGPVTGAYRAECYGEWTQTLQRLQVRIVSNCSELFRIVLNSTSHGEARGAAAAVCVALCAGGGGGRPRGGGAVARVRVRRCGVSVGCARQHDSTQQGCWEAFCGAGRALPVPVSDRVCAM